jgi:hypothetical protein
MNEPIGPMTSPTSLNPNPIPVVGANSTGTRRVGKAIGLVKGGTWGSVLLLQETQHLTAYGRPSWFESGPDDLPVGQFEEWPEVWQAAVALSLRPPGATLRDTLPAITRTLGEYYSDEQMRRLPLSAVADFLRRLREWRSTTAKAQSPPAPGRPIADRGDAEATDSNRDGDAASAGTTPEARVARYLKDHPTALIAEVRTGTELSEQRICRTKAWKNHQEALLKDYLERSPGATVADAAAFLCCSPAKIVTMSAWKSYQARKEATVPQCRVKDRRLTRLMLEGRADDKTADPTGQAEAQDELFQQLMQAVKPETRLQLKKLHAEEKLALIKHLLEEVDLGQVDGLDPKDRFDVLVQLSESWLEKWEQEVRYRAQEERRR